MRSKRKAPEVAYSKVIWTGPTKRDKKEEGKKGKRKRKKKKREKIT